MTFIDQPDTQSALATGVPLAAVLTPRGRGAVASIRMCGSVSMLERAGTTLFLPANRKPLADQPVGRVVFGRWGAEPREEVVVCRRGDATIDIHCHGGDAAVRRILDDLEHAGCRIVSWQELETTEAGLFATECRDALANASTLRTSNFLLEQCAGVLRDALEALQEC